ncbi:uncharacterized protein [Haliotis cracherodii]|uniref:uncharacterized protein n=1 Tax=Haliotis cracherodii TaxID=6455 RepID=UPI0039EB6621
MKVLLVSLMAAWLGISKAKVLFIHVPRVFGNQNDPVVQEYYEDACRNCSLSDTGRFYTHGKACNMYMFCIQFGPSSWLMFGYLTPEGAVFNDRGPFMERMFLQDGERPIPNRHGCPARVGHPCDTGMRMPINQDPCSGYQTCSNNVIVKTRCNSPYSGFNAMTQQCDLACAPRTRFIISERCEPNLSSDDYYLSYQTVQYADEPEPRVEFFNLQCLLGYKYQDYTKCGCQPYNATEKPCETVTVVHLKSLDDSWRLARNNNPLMDSSAITGNGTIVNASERYGNAAYFSGRQTFSAHKVMGNDLGLYFDLTFAFQSLQSDSAIPGLTFPPRDAIAHRDYALADNSACDIMATYGCKLQGEGFNLGRVVCYVVPEGDSGTYNTTVISEPMDLTKMTRVYFAKEDERGLMRITQGSYNRITPITFPKGVRAVGNSCPLSIGAGTKKRYFTGFMDDLVITKYCGPFM